MELLAILATLQLSEHVQDEHETSKIKEIVTDALGACKIANKLQLDPHMQATYTHPAVLPAHTHDDDVRRHTKMDQSPRRATELLHGELTGLETDDCLNHVADKIADRRLPGV
jgi:hypothetical protein